MSHPDQLRQYARDCLRLSQDMTSPELRIHLINMAEAWAALASQSERIATLCATVPVLEAAASGSLAPDGGQANGSDRGAVESPALSPEPSERPRAEGTLKRKSGDGEDH